MALGVKLKSVKRQASMMTDMVCIVDCKMCMRKNYNVDLDLLSFRLSGHIYETMKGKCVYELCRWKSIKDEVVYVTVTFILTSRPSTTGCPRATKSPVSPQLVMSVRMIYSQWSGESLVS